MVERSSACCTICELGKASARKRLTSHVVLLLSRMLSNRESARRSRHRKQAHLLDLENQVSQLSAEKEQLEEHLQQVAERVRLGDDENSCLRRQVSNLKGKIVKLAAAIRGDGPVPSLEDLEDEDEVLPSSGGCPSLLQAVVQACSLVSSKSRYEVTPPWFCGKRVWGQMTRWSIAVLVLVSGLV